MKKPDTNLVYHLDQIKGLGENTIAFLMKARN